MQCVKKDYLAISITLQDCWGGAQTSIYLAVSEEVEEVSGKYFDDCKVKSCYKV